MELRKHYAHKKKILMRLLISSFDATIRVKRAFHPAPASRGFASHVFLVLRLTAVNFPYSPLFRTPIAEKRGTSRLKKECDNVKVSVEIYRRSAQSPTRSLTTALHGTYTYLSKMRVEKVSSTHYLVHANQRTDLIDNCNQLKIRTKNTGMLKTLKKRKKPTTGF